MATVFFSISLTFVLCIIGRVDYTTAYSSRLIDTIVITSRNEPVQPAPAGQIIDVKGRILYSNGAPYANELVELRSTPRYTTTDADGYFLFRNVSEGTHTISAIRNNVVLASASLEVERAEQEDDIKIVRLETGNLLVQVSLKVIEINIALQIDGGDLTLLTVEVARRVDDPMAPPELPDPETQLPPEQPPGLDDPDHPGPDLPPRPDEPSVPDVPADPGDGPSGPVVPPVEEGAPDITASDDYGVGGVNWTVATSVDIFGPRPGTSGVKTIGGETVIAPGSSGVYTFKIENPESRAVEYRISLEESDQNSPKLPMLYRIGAGLGGLGDSPWRIAGSTSVETVTIERGATHYYTLEWKWASGDDTTDTAIGLQESNPAYVLSIMIDAWYK